MPKFNVIMQRTEYRTHVFESIEADTPEQAEEKVEQELIPDFDWHHTATCTHADENVVLTKEVG